ncbi:hypothetical protein K5X82_06965 [Halosquirtibacter xylanolyticus]|uniref:hypothetical protein n=1 Tax=Halosquirtibacter xylanolyticus TaxID=3374599 RepID=UPI0037494FDC|nr:hypothetical protein K5X82_06965 [Prolixibacteraceae bacterium]
MNEFKIIIINNRKMLRYGLIAFVSLLFTSCSLLKFETEQVPLSNYEVNTRELLQRQGSLSILAFNDICDSIRNNTTSLELKEATLRLKLNFVSGMEATVYQNPPIYALIDTWIYVSQVSSYLSNDDMAKIIGKHSVYLRSEVTKVKEDFDAFAKRTLRITHYSRKKKFVDEYSSNHLITSIDLERDSPFSDYTEYEGIPDTSFVKTTGTLSQVMSDFSNRVKFNSNALPKKVKWESQIIAMSAGIDSVNIQATLDSIQIQIERFNKIVEESPEMFQEGLDRLVAETTPLLRNIDIQWANSLRTIHHERVALDSMILRERLAFDSMIQREREIAFVKVNEMAVDVTKEAIRSVKETISSILIYIILLFVVILVIPFTMGYYSGKWATHHKRKKQCKPKDIS